MHFTSTSTCMNFWSWFYFLTPMDYSPWSEGKIWLFWSKLKRGKISETGEATPTKIGFHAFYVDLYLHKFFEPILFFDPHGLYMVWRENLAILKANLKGQNLWNQRYHAHQSWFACVSNQPLLAWIFWASSIFWPPWSFLVTPTLCLHFLSSFFLLIKFTPFLSDFV